MVQIKEDLVVHGVGGEHDHRIHAVLERFHQFNIKLRPEVMWFGNVYKKQKPSTDLEKVVAINH